MRVRPAIVAMVVAIVGLGGIGSFVFAQRSFSQAEVSQALPRVYADTLTFSVAADNTVQGSFKVSNAEDSAIGGLMYELLVLSPANTPSDGTPAIDNPLVYDRFLTSDTFALGAQQEKTVNFKHQFIPLPKGQYRLRVQLRLNNSRELGWATIPIILGGGLKFATLEPGPILVSSKDPITGEEREQWSPGQGVNVDAEQEVTLQATAGNKNKEVVTGTVVVTAQRLLSGDADITTAVEEPITIKAKTSKQKIVLPLTTASQPGVYAARLVIQDDDGQPVSNIIEYRYVVRGHSASIVSAHFQELGLNTATVAYGLAGPADRESQVDTQVEIKVLDGQEVVGEITAEATLALNLESGTATIPLDHPIQGVPGIAVVIDDRDDGHSLASYQTDYPDIPGPKRTIISESSLLWFWLSGITIALFLLFLIMTLWSLRPLFFVLLATLLIGGGIGVWDGVEASGIMNSYLRRDRRVVSSGSPIDLFVNSPVHLSTVSDLSGIPYEARITWFVCMNSVIDTNFKLYGRDDHHAVLFPPDVIDLSGWTLISVHNPFSNIIDCANCSNPTAIITSSITFLPDSVNTFNTGRLTLLTRLETVYYDNISDNNLYINEDYTWLTFFLPTPQPSPSPLDFRCTPSSQNVRMWEPAPMQAVDGNAGLYTWETDDGQPTNVAGNGLTTFAPFFNTPGVKSVTVQNDTNVAVCQVNVEAIPLNCVAIPDVGEIESYQPVTFHAFGGPGPYQWLADGGTPNTSLSDQPLFTTRYRTTGLKTVTVTNDTQTGTCQVTVAAQPSPSPTPSPSSSSEPEVGDFQELP